MLLNDQPLYLPEGSVRALIALSVVWAYITGVIEADVALVVLGFYFAGRQASA